MGQNKISYFVVDEVKYLDVFVCDCFAVNFTKLFDYLVYNQE